MKKRILRIILSLVTLIAIFASTGCSELENLKKIRMSALKIESFNIAGLKTVNGSVSFLIDNPSKDINISDIEGTINRYGQVWATFVADPVSIPGKTSTRLQVTGSASLAPGVSPLSLLGLLTDPNLDAFTLDISAKAGLGKSAGRRVTLKDIPVSKIVRHLK